MPFYDASSHNCKQFIGAIDVLQATIDDAGGSCPVKLFGDFNAQLPIADSPKPNWIREEVFLTTAALVVYIMYEVCHRV
jgi:hypothetical protein